MLQPAKRPPPPSTVEILLNKLVIPFAFLHSIPPTQPSITVISPANHALLNNHLSLFGSLQTNSFCNNYLVDISKLPQSISSRVLLITKAEPTHDCFNVQSNRLLMMNGCGLYTASRTVIKAHTAFCLTNCWLVEHSKICYFFATLLSSAAALLCWAAK